MSSQVLSMKAFSYVRLQAGIHWFNMLRGATQILRFTEEIGNYWFSNIAVDKWDGLSNQVVSAKTIESFNPVTAKELFYFVLIIFLHYFYYNFS